MRFVYIAGSYADVRTPVLIAKELRTDGHYGFVPQLTYFTDTITPSSDADRRAQAQLLLSKSDCVLQLLNQSKESIEEVAYAECLRLPVFTNYKSLLTFFREGSGVSS